MATLVSIIKFVGYFIMYAFITAGVFIIVGLALFVLMNFSLIVIPLVVIAFIAFLALQKVKGR